MTGTFIVSAGASGKSLTQMNSRGTAKVSLHRLGALHIALNIYRYLAPFRLTRLTIWDLAL